MELKDTGFMQGAVLEGREKLSIKTLPKPTIDKSEVLIRVQCCGICGTDLHLYTLGPEVFQVPAGRIMGHEFSGDVVEVGTAVKGWEVGDRVVVEPSLVCGTCYWCKRQQFNFCNSLEHTGTAVDGAYAGFIKAPEYQLYRLPKEVTYQEGALVEPLSVALRGVRQSNWKPGNTVAILGCGPIGVLVALWARALGADKIFAIETAPPRIAIAERLGIADVVINARKDDPVDRITELTSEIGADIVFECTGNDTAQAEALDIVRKGGDVIILGVSPTPNPFDFLKVVYKEITIKGAIAYNSLFGVGDGEFETSINFLKSKRINVNQIVTSEIPLADIDKGFKKLAAGDDLQILVNLQDAWT